MLQEALPSAHGMAEGLGRVVLTRDRFARSWGLGDRKTPTAHTPALILLDGDEDVDITGAVTGEAITDSDAAVDVTGEVTVTGDGDTGAVSITGEAGAAALAWAAWWRAARRRFFLLN